ncbi:phosphoglycerate mutase-like protein [Lichtheimia hyalospora FSU 10163]|nr:phosphoglycerate mutase-like protein [Lichtheimia hyalospora FSU 10163]
MFITLLRHGESEGNMLQCWQGITDGPLTVVGEQQATLATQELKTYKFTTILTSPLQRALATAKKVHAALPEPRPALIVEPLLTELNMGSLEGQSWSVSYSIHTRDTPFPGGGESLDDVYFRASHFLMQHLEQVQEGHILIVGHGMLLTELVHALCTHYGYTWIDLRWSNTGITTLHCTSNNELELIRVNDTRHLMQMFS